MRQWIDLFEGHDDDAHGEALAQTGFWGKQGAGCIVFAKSTKRFLLAYRSKHVEQPHTFGTWGGAIDSKESPAAAVRREFAEESGYAGHIAEMIPLSVFKSGSFRYHNFVVVVDDEFVPQLDWESEGFEWFDFDNWPTPLHFGVESLLNNNSDVEKLQELLT